MPLLVGSEKGVRIAYVRDEPRVALVAELTNGYTVAVVHLSFVPLVNIWQLRKIQRELRKFPGKKILIGDLNLPWGLPSKVSNWKSLVTKNTYPSWKPAIQFDYLLSENDLEVTLMEFSEMPISDHLPIGIEIH
jgi:endonuclease/exonuclease/phosphatase family metal-dependent hydrolase